MSERKPSYQDLEERIKQLELKLADLQLIADYSVNWEVLRDKTGKLIYSSPAFKKITGYCNEDFLTGKITIKDIIHPEDYLFVIEKMELASERKTVISFENRFFTKKKELRHAAIEIRPIWLDKNYVGSRSSLRDVTDTKEAELALKESEEKHKFLFDNTVQGVVYENADGEIIFANKAAEKILGLTIDQMRGRKSIDPRWRAIHEDGSNFPGETHPVMISLKTGKPVFNQVMGVFNPKSNNYTWININSIPRFKAKNSKPFEVVATFEDITQIRNKTRELLISKDLAEESKENYRALFENLNYGFVLNEVITDEKDNPVDFKTLEANAYYEAFSGLKPGEVIGKTIKEIMPNADDNMIRQYGNVGLTGVPFTIEYFSQTFNKYIKVHCYSPKPKHFASLFEDITERKKAEEELIRAKEKAEENEIRYKSLFSNMMNAFGLHEIIFNEKGEPVDYIFLEVNPVWEKVVGIKAESVIGKRIKEIMPSIEQTWLDRYGRIVLTGNPEEFTDYNAATQKYYNVFAYKLEGNKFAVVFNDVTDKKQFELELIKAKDRAEVNEFFLRRSQAVGNVGSYRTDFKAGFWKSSATLDRIFGIDKDFIRSVEGWLDIIHPDDRQMMNDYLVEEVIKNKKTFTKEYRIVRINDKKVRWVYGQGDVSFDENDNIVEMIGTIQDITDKKTSEIELIKAKELAEESQKQLKAIFDNSQDAIGISKNGKNVLFNNRYINLFGWNSQDEIIGKSLLEQIAPGERKRIKEFIKKRSEGEDVPSSYETVGLKKNGEEFPFEVSVGHYNLNNELYTIASIRDITERKNAEEKLTQFMFAIESTSDAIGISNAQGVHFYQNKAMCDLFGFKTPEELHDIGGGTAAIKDPDIAKEMFETIQNGKPWIGELEMVKKDGTVFYAFERADAIKDDNGNILGLIGIVTDITEKKKVEHELIDAKEKAEEKERKIKHQNDEILFNNERLESLLRVSQHPANSVQELLNFALEEAISLTKSKIGYIYFYNGDKKQFILNTWSKNVMKDCAVIDPQTVYDLEKTGCWGEAVRQKKPIIINDYQAENPLKKGIPEGHVKLSKFLTIPVFSHGKIVAVAGVANKKTDYDQTDIRQMTLLMDSVWKISERLMLIKDLKLAKEKAEESDRLKTAFLQNMSHEIRTPLNAIMGFSDLLLSNFGNRSKLENFTKIIKIRSNDLLEIINDILDISKIEAGSLLVNNEECRLTELFSELEVLFGEQKIRINKQHISLQFEIDNNLCNTTIITDKGKLKQILFNLMGNALKFTNEGHIKCHCILEDTKIIFMVSDTGIGIPPDKVSFIFERFAQLNALPKKNLGGTGLGLSIVKGLVNLLGGSITVSSELNKGSEFKFTVDYKVAEPKVITETNTETLNVLEQNKTILIVEDDFYNAEYIKEILSGFNFNIICVGFAHEAIKLSAEEPIDLILMDIRLPDLDGYEAARIILESNPEIKIIAQTAFANIDEKDRALKMGCVAYISKPIHKHDLIELIQKNL